MTQEFHISVTPVGKNQYLVRTEKVASGVPLAEEQVVWPVEAWLRHTSQLMNDPLLGLLEGQGTYTSRSGSQRGTSVPPVALNKTPLQDPPLINLVELGQQLYNGLFQGMMRDSWTCAQAIAQNRRELLQLRLGVKGRQLASLPWEVLHAGDRPVATGTDVVFSRYQPGNSSILHTHVRTLNQPLKILMAIAAPTDQDSLQLKREVLHLQAELRRESIRQNPLERTPTPPEIQLTILEQPDREQLTQALEQGQYQVFHYAGHSNLGASGGELYLVSSRTGLTETLSGDDLAGLLVNNGIQFAVLNSCRGAYGNTPHLSDEVAEVNLAESLVKRGIPGVLAMAERIPDEVALTLTRLLYRNLNLGYPIDLSLSRARQGLISAYGSHQLYWALPILYLHREFDGSLTASQQKDLVTETPDYPIPAVDESKNPAFRLGAAPQEQGWEEIETEEIDDFLDDIIYEDDLAGDDDSTAFIGDVLKQFNTTPSSLEKSEPQTPAFLEQENLQPSLNLTEVKPNSIEIPKSRIRILLLSFLVLFVPVSVGLGLLQFRNLQVAKQINSEVVPRQTHPPTPQALDITTAQTDYVLGIAIEQFYSGNLSSAVQATTELLNRGALTEAKAALAAVSVQDSDKPEVNFLNGRLAWQFIQQGSANYTLDEVRRYWARAVQQQPHSAEYNTALGFAYYAEGNLEAAYQTWLKVLDLEEPTFAKNTQPKANSTTAVSTVALAPKTPLDTYAGLGLVLMKSAQNLPTQQQDVRLSKAIKFREKVLSENPTEFQPNTLAEQWLWSKEMVRDWQLLLQE